MVAGRFPHRWRALAVGIVVCLPWLVSACAGSAAQSTGTTTSAPSVTPTATAMPPVVYVALGASDAVGVGADDPNTQGYVPRLIARLPKASDALNLGILGITLDSALAEELPQALTDHPTLVTVWLTANDFRECVGLPQYTADLDNLLGELQTRTGAKVFVANLPDMSLLPAMQNGAPGAGTCLQGKTPSQIRAQVLSWNAAIAPVVAAHHDYLVDLFNSSLASHPEYVYRDGFHPSTQGYAVLADLFWAQIQAHGDLPQS
jgi:lysophospholipase L1-like esterase